MEKLSWIFVLFCLSRLSRLCEVRWPKESLAALNKTHLHGFSNYHSEDAAICCFQSASQQRGMKRAGSQAEQSRYSSRRPMSHWQRLTVCVCVCESTQDRGVQSAAREPFVVLELILQLTWCRRHAEVEQTPTKNSVIMAEAEELNALPDVFFEA